jgi:hypothetical protein
MVCVALKSSFFILNTLVGNKKNFMGESGKIYNLPDLQVEKPCQKCIILGMSAGLEYANGTDANTQDGMWLHHVRST